MQHKLVEFEFEGHVTQFHSDATLSLLSYTLKMFQFQCKIKKHLYENLTQIHRVTPESHPGGPENALFCGQEKFSSKSEPILPQSTFFLIMYQEVICFKCPYKALDYPICVF